MITSIPQDIKAKVQGIVEAFNKTQFTEGKLNYVFDTDGPYLYFKVIHEGQVSPVSRVKYTGNFKEWEFEIYHSSTDKYVSSEKDFPGKKYVDGSLEGAMKAGIETYYA